MTATEIEWTDVVWNPTTGCDRVSPGCDNCYALTMAKRLKGMGQAKYQTDGDPRTSGPGFGIAEHSDTLSAPLSWRKPRKVFVNSMSDLFHKGVSDEFIAEVFAVMALTPHITYQVLTKRHARMRSLLASGEYIENLYDLALRALMMDGQASDQQCSAAPALRRDRPLPNVWLGVSAENQQWADLRIPALLETPAAVRWVSAEPLLGPLDLQLWLADGWACPHCSFRHTSTIGATCVGCKQRTWPLPYSRLDWVVTGGESGPGARPMDLAWAETIVKQCQASGVPVLVKQLGTVTGGRTHHDIDTFPEGLRVRQYPEVMA